MSQVKQSANIQHLENLFSRRSPNNKYASQSRIEEFNESIAKEIINGDTVVSPTKDEDSDHVSSRYDGEKKRAYLLQAKRQKEELEQRLNHVNRSIDSIKQYSFLKAESQPLDLSKSRDKRALSPEALAELKQKERKISEAAKEHRERMAKIREQQERRQRVKMQQQQEELKKREDRRKAKKKKQILQNMKKIQSQIQQREQQSKKSDQKVKEILHRKELYKRLEQQYQQQENLTLEERKRKLSEIRSLHKPIDIKEIEEHEKRILQIRRQKEDIRQRERKINESSIRYTRPYVSSFYMKAAEEKKAEHWDPLTSSKIKNDKIKQFVEHVKEHFVPEASEKKRRQIEQVIEKEEQLRRQREQKIEETKRLGKLKGIEYLDEMKKLPKRRGDSLNNISKIEEQGSKTARPVYKNYLTHHQQKDQEGSSGISSPHKTEGWTAILKKNKLSQKDKARLLQYQSEKVEEHLRRKQQQSRLLKQDNEEDIDNEYFRMIKAKLDLLNSD